MARAAQEVNMLNTQMKYEENRKGNENLWEGSWGILLRT